MPLLNMRLARPDLLVDIGRIAGLDYIRDADGGLAIGAMTRQSDIERSALVAQRQPMLAAGTRFIAHPQIRNRGTIGGSISHADPAAVYPALAVALDMQIEVAGPAGHRSVDAADFFITYLTTALEPDEILVELRLPGFPPRAGWSFKEVSRRHGDFALAGVAATMEVDSSGVCSFARIVLFGVAAVPLRVEAAEQLLLGSKVEQSLFEEAGAMTSDTLDEPLSDIHASADYRRHLAGVLTRRALAEAAGRAA